MPPRARRGSGPGSRPSRSVARCKPARRQPTKAATPSKRTIRPDFPRRRGRRRPRDRRSSWGQVGHPGVQGLEARHDQQTGHVKQEYHAQTLGHQVGQPKLFVHEKGIPVVCRGSRDRLTCGRGTRSASCRARCRTRGRSGRGVAANRVGHFDGTASARAARSVVRPTMIALAGIWSKPDLARLGDLRRGASLSLSARSVAPIDSASPSRHGPYRHDNFTHVTESSGVAQITY